MSDANMTPEQIFQSIARCNPRLTEAELRRFKAWFMEGWQAARQSAPPQNQTDARHEGGESEDTDGLPYRLRRAMKLFHNAEDNWGGEMIGDHEHGAPKDQTILEWVLASKTAPTPPGYVLVPEEPTEAMVKAGGLALSGWVAPAMHAEDAYRVMIAAAKREET